MQEIITINIFAFKVRPSILNNNNRLTYMNLPGLCMYRVGQK